MKHSKFIAVIVVSVMMLSLVQPVKVDARTWKEWGRNTKEVGADMLLDGAESYGYSRELDGETIVQGVLGGAMWLVGATVEYFSDDAPEEKPQPKEEKSSWWPF